MVALFGTSPSLKHSAWSLCVTSFSVPKPACLLQHTQFTNTGTMNNGLGSSCCQTAQGISTFLACTFPVNCKVATRVCVIQSAEQFSQKWVLAGHDTTLYGCNSAPYRTLSTATHNNSGMTSRLETECRCKTIAGVSCPCLQPQDVLEPVSSSTNLFCD